MEITLDNAQGPDALPAAIVKGANEAYTQNIKGLDALDKNDYATALACFRKAMEIVPNYLDAENNVGVTYFRKGTVAEAEKIWLGLIHREPKYALSYYNMGILLYHDKDIEGAIDWFEKSLLANKQFSEAFLMLGRIYFQQKDKSRSISYLKQAFKINPNNQDIWSYYAYGLIQAGDTVEAKKILLGHKDNVEALKLLAGLAASNKQFDQAAEYLSTASTKGSNAALLLDLASSQVEARKFNPALVTLKKYFALPNITPAADAFVLAGIASKETGDMAGARTYFEKGSKQYPKDPILRYNLGQMCFYQKDYAQAEKIWQSVSDTLQDPSLYYLRSVTALRSGNLPIAEEMIRKALKIDNKAEYHDLLGTILYKKGDKDKAAVSFRDALKADPHLKSAQLNLSLISQSQRDLEAAINQQELLLQSCSDNCNDVSYQLSVLFFCMKEYEEALKVIQAVPDANRDERMYRHMAICYRQMQDWEKAITMLEKARQRFILDNQAIGELAELYMLGGQYTKATDILLVLIDKGADNAWRIYYQLGYAAMELNDLTKAKMYLEKSLKLKSNNVASQGLLAFINNREGNAALARQMWEKNAKDDPNNPTLWINLGLSFEKDGNYNKALENYSKAAALSPADKAIQINIGNAYAGMSQYTDAMHAYNQALTSPKRELAAYNIFLTSQKMNNRSKAEEALAILAREFSGSECTRRAQADMSLVKGDTAQAMKLIESISDKDPSDYLTLAKISGARKNFQAADKYLEKVPSEPAWASAKKDMQAQIIFLKGDCAKAIAVWTDLNDTSFAAEYNLAMASFTCKQYDRVLSIAQSILPRATGPDRADVCRIAGNAAFSLKQWEQAKSWYAQLSNVEANNPIVQFNLAVANYNLGDMDKAWDYYQRARQLDPSLTNKDIEKRYDFTKNPNANQPTMVMDSNDLLYNQAVELQNKNDTARAEAIYNQIIKKDPAYALAWNNLGTLYAARADLEKAIQYYQKSIEKRHDIPEAYANLVNIYIAMGNFSQAKRWLIKGEGHNPDSDVLKQMGDILADSLAAQKKN
jgi:tetratricopeptide (TPR) repeat protein